jgi:hypothetical protein
MFYDLMSYHVICMLINDQQVCWTLKMIDMRSCMQILISFAAGGIYIVTSIGPLASSLLTSQTRESTRTKKNPSSGQ